MIQGLVEALDGMDAYSNILYLKEDPANLKGLVH
jgi:hypothetical protein